jgi:hypothetical protein
LNLDKKLFYDAEELLSLLEETYEILKEARENLRSSEKFIDDNLIEKLSESEPEVRDPSDLAYELKGLQEELLILQRALSTYLYEDHS